MRAMRRALLRKEAPDHGRALHNGNAGVGFLDSNCGIDRGLLEGQSTSKHRGYVAGADVGVIFDFFDGIMSTRNYGALVAPRVCVAVGTR